MENQNENDPPSTPPSTTYTLFHLFPTSSSGLVGYFLLLQVNFPGSPNGTTKTNFVFV